MKYASQGMMVRAGLAKIDRTYTFRGENSDILAGAFLQTGQGDGCDIYQNAENGDIVITNGKMDMQIWLAIDRRELTDHLAERIRDLAIAEAAANGERLIN